MLCKAICHNICVLIEEMHEIGVKPAWLYGTNEVLNAAKTIIDSNKPLFVQEGHLHKNEV